MCGVRLSNAWSIYRGEGDNLGKLRLIPYRVGILEGLLPEKERELERFRSAMRLRRIRLLAG